MEINNLLPFAATKLKDLLDDARATLVACDEYVGGTQEDAIRDAVEILEAARKLHDMHRDWIKEFKELAGELQSDSCQDDYPVTIRSDQLFRFLNGDTSIRCLVCGKKVNNKCGIDHYATEDDKCEDCAKRDE